MKTLAFDVYGTLIDTQGVLSLLEQYLGDDAAKVSESWREKQLEYSFRRGLMQNYQPFSVCTRDGLNFACQKHHVNLSQAQKDALLERYLTLPAFDDVIPALEALKAQGVKLFAFSNGEAQTVQNLLKNANIDAYFDGVVSCEPLKTYKPNPAVYAYLLRQTQTKSEQTWLVSSNPFDVIGASSFGLHTAWVQRSKQSILDPWDITPDRIIERLDALADIKIGSA